MKASCGSNLSHCRRLFEQAGKTQSTCRWQIPKSSKNWRLKQTATIVAPAIVIESAYIQNPRYRSRIDFRSSPFIAAKVKKKFPTTPAVAGVVLLAAVVPAADRRATTSLMSCTRRLASQRWKRNSGALSVLRCFGVDWPAMFAGATQKPTMRRVDTSITNSTQQLRSSIDSQRNNQGPVTLKQCRGLDEDAQLRNAARLSHQRPQPADNTTTRRKL